MSEPANELDAPNGSASFVLDCKGREILPGDTIKVFHFIGARRKRHFMYKYIEAIERRETWRNGVDALRVSHLNLKGKSYLVLRLGQREEGWEIVQGFGSNGTHFEKRPRRKPIEKGQP